MYACMDIKKCLSLILFFACLIQELNYLYCIFWKYKSLKSTARL